MNPDFDDPNNHAPKITDGDEWDDLDAPEDNAPAKRKEPGLPPKRPSREASVKLHEPRSKADESETPVEPGPTEKYAPAEATAGKKPKKRRSQKPANKEASAKRPVEKVDDKAVETLPEEPPAKKKPEPRNVRNTPALEEIAEPEADDEEVEDSVPSEKLVLPPAPGGKRFRVNQIGGDPAAHQPLHRPVRVANQVTSPLPQENNEEVARRRRRFVSGERGDWGEQKGRGSAKWMVLTGVGVIALVVFAVVASQRGGKGRERNQSMFSQLAPAEKPAEEAPPDEGMMEMLTDSQDVAKDLYAAFAKARSPEELAPLVFSAEKNLPIISERWEVREGIPKSWRPGDDSLWTVLNKEDVRYGLLEGIGADYVPFTAYFRRQDGELKMDWKASTGYSSTEFSELKQGIGDASEVRVVISRADFFTFALPEEDYVSFKLMSPDGEVNLWGYVEKETDLGEKISDLFVRSQITGETQTEVQVLLALAPGPESGLPSQWMIEELRGLTWLDEQTK